VSGEFEQVRRAASPWREGRKEAWNFNVELKVGGDRERQRCGTTALLRTAHAEGKVNFAISIVRLARR
jgi:hypothetical protein